MTWRRIGLPVVVVGLVLALAGPAAAVGGGNGYVLMVHGWFEPYVEGTPHAPGTVAAIRDDDHLTFSAIPYGTESGRPEVVQEPRLEITGLTSGETRTYEPNVDSDNPVCRRETTFPGHEGPLAACPTFRVPADDLAGELGVTMVLRFVDERGPQAEALSVRNHQFIHGHIDFGVPADLATLDADVEPEPFIVEQVLDPLP